MTHLTRRDFLKLAALSLTTGFLAACNAAPGGTESLPISATAIPSAPTTAPSPTPALQPVTGAYDPANFVAAEILGRPTGTSVTVNVVPAAATQLYYEYGTVPGGYTAQTDPQTAEAGLPVETLIGGLPPGTRVYYRLRYAAADGLAAGPEHSFVTAPAPGSRFAFGIMGDSHPERDGKQFNADLYERTLRQAAAGGIDFYMTIGDDFSVDTLRTIDNDSVTQVYVAQRQWLSLVGAPVFLVNGNHEQAALANLDGTPDNVAVWAQNARNRYFPQPAPDDFYTGDVEPVEHIGLLRDYYAWTWGEALFVVIDPYWHSPIAVDNTMDDSERNRNLWLVTLGETQYRWLQQALESSTARYKFVFAHHVNGTGRGGVECAPLFEWGGQDRRGRDQFATQRPGWEMPIHQLMATNGVTIFVQGHDHLFARQELDRVTYLTLPTPADPNYALDNGDHYLSGDLVRACGYVRVTVAPEAVTIEYLRSFLPEDEGNGRVQGQVAYSYTIPGQP